MNWFYRIPIYLGYAVAITGFIAHFTGWNFLAIITLDPGMSSAVTGTLLAVVSLWFYSINHPKVWKEKSE